MGNATSSPSSTTSPTTPNNVQNSPRPGPPPTPSHNTPGKPQPHRSLRAKKKSLELPDLAVLALTPAVPSATTSPLPSPGAYYPYRRPPAPPMTSSPIPIPQSPHVPRTRPPPTFPSVTQIHQETNPPLPLPAVNRRGNPFIRGATLPYSSTRSFTTRGNTQPQRQQQQQQHQPPQQHHRGPGTPRPPFQPETVHSTIPIALTKAQPPTHPTCHLPADEQPEPVPVVITWRGGGRTVILARAGDDDWKGRQPMIRSSPTSPIFNVTINVFPGTHHIRFLVDDVWRVADDLPTAVDDEGSLANYVAVAIFTPPGTSALPAGDGGVTPTPGGALTSASAPVPPNATSGLPRAHSFWSTASSSFAGTNNTNNPSYHGPALWTSELPRELLAAAREEEVYLAACAAATYADPPPAPNIPPAPQMPRHLDKLILNVKPSVVVGAASGSRVGRGERGGAAAGGAAAGGRRGSVSAGAGNAGAVVNGDAAIGARARLDGAGLADDTSVLPVPSHVVLHHLSTSAIRNGVLAVGNTTRYRKKYLTTIYYKPT